LSGQRGSSQGNKFTSLDLFDAKHNCYCLGWIDRDFLLMKPLYCNAVVPCLALDEGIFPFNSKNESDEFGLV